MDRLLDHRSRQHHLIQPNQSKLYLMRRDSRSPQAVAYRKLYFTAQWRAIRRAQLEEEPYCAMCLQAGQRTPATVCDHVEPHRGDPIKFYGGPFQSLCAMHHDRHKQRLEIRGFSSTPGADGWPVDPKHPLNRAK